MAQNIPGRPREAGQRKKIEDREGVSGAGRSTLILKEKREVMNEREAGGGSPAAFRSFVIITQIFQLVAVVYMLVLSSCDNVGSEWGG